MFQALGMWARPEAVRLVASSGLSSGLFIGHDGTFCWAFFTALSAPLPCPTQAGVAVRRSLTRDRRHRFAGLVLPYISIIDSKVSATARSCKFGLPRRPRDRAQLPSFAAAMLLEFDERVALHAVPALPGLAARLEHGQGAVVPEIVVRVAARASAIGLGPLRIARQIAGGIALPSGPSGSLRRNCRASIPTPVVASVLTLRALVAGAAVFAGGMVREEDGILSMHLGSSATPASLADFRASTCQPATDVSPGVARSSLLPAAIVVLHAVDELHGLVHRLTVRVWRWTAGDIRHGACLGQSEGGDAMLVHVLRVEDAGLGSARRSRRRVRCWATSQSRPLRTASE